MSGLVIPSEIPWARLKDRELEEAIYWLLDDMGAKELRWRVGGSGSGGADGGRDLEAHFYTSLPDGELEQQRWWLECKGRAGTVEPDVVKATVHNASGLPDVDVLVIVTNSQFSNPARDWVDGWQSTHPRPRVRMWERADLERLFSKHPSACLRVFSGALSLQGRQQAVVQEFWEKCRYIPRLTLEALYADETELAWNGPSVLAVVASEVANSDLAARPWPYRFSAEDALHTLKFGLEHSGYFLLRSEEAGREYDPYAEALAYLTLVALERNGAVLTRAAFEGVWGDRDMDVPDHVKQGLFAPVVRTAQDYLRDVCSDDCRRVITDAVAVSSDQVKNFWDRFTFRPPSVEPDPGEDAFLILEMHPEPCKVGLPLSDTVSCPLIGEPHRDEPLSALLDLLPSWEAVVKARRDANMDVEDGS